MFRIILIFVSLVVLAGISNGATPLTPGDKPQQRTLAGYKDAYCSSVPEKFTACRVRTNEEGDARFVFFKDAKELASIEAPFWSRANASPEDFVFYRGDFDNDASHEFVL